MTRRAARAGMGPERVPVGRGVLPERGEVSVAKKAAQKRSAARQDALRIVRRIREQETEAQFQRRVREVLAVLGFVVWVFPIMKRTIAGVPDLTFWHPMRPGRLYFWELKTQHGRVRPEQRVAIEHLSTVPGVDARIVRPADWEALRDNLAHAAQNQPAGEGRM